jgi:hypothetical protein
MTLSRQLSRQSDFATLLLRIGTGSQESDNLCDIMSNEIETRTMRIGLHDIKTFTCTLQDTDNAITETRILEWLYPLGFDPANMTDSAIICGLNDDVDSWNTKIQSLSKNEKISLFSKDKLSEVDDPKGVLKSILSLDVLNRFQDPKCPPHELILAVGDICYLYRSLSKKDGLVTNARVRILQIKTYSIRVQTLGSHPKSFFIPRIRFTVKLPWGKSYKLTRYQFPLRLAYAITINKSQGQEYNRVLFDIRNQPFQHGHAYVGLSRVKEHHGIAVYVGEDDIINGTPIINNVVYEELLSSIDPN